MVSAMHDRPTRRQFLRATLGAVAAASAASPGQGRGEGHRPVYAVDKNDPWAGFTVGVQSYSFRNFDRDQALKRIHELGLKHVEFYQKHAPLESTPEQIKAILNLCKEYEITPVAFGVQGFKKDHDFNQKVFDFGKAMGLKFFSADPDPDSFDSLDKLCEEYQIGIAIHPHGPTGKNKLHRWYSAEAILKAVKDRHRLIGSCLDTGHLIRAAQLGEKLDPAEQVLVMGKRNFGLHLKDHDNEKKRDVVFGKGSLDVKAVVKALREVKFAGWLAIEYEANPDNPSPDIAACLEVLKAAIQ